MWPSSNFGYCDGGDFANAGKVDPRGGGLGPQDYAGMVGLPGSGAGVVQNGGPGMGVPPGHMYPGVGPQDSKFLI